MTGFVGASAEATVDAVVVAAGSSVRMGGVDKLAASVGGRPVLRWALEGIAAVPIVRRVMLVTAPERAAELSRTGWVRDLDAAVLVGGPRRQESVAAAVRASDADIILVHDGARPVVSRALVERVAAAAVRYGAALPVLPVDETVKQILNGQVRGTLPREELYRAQTPQGVRRALLLRAYERFPPDGPASYTDEAALLETIGVPVHTVEGDPRNLKITRPMDLELAEMHLGGRPGVRRVGHGWDSHPFGSDDYLALGGITISEAPRLSGHSDGDVALHALADALLGAAGMEDLGRLFPAGRDETRGVASRVLLRDVLARLTTAGARVTAVDVTIVGARPWLGGERLDAMRSAIAEILEIPPRAVGMKASSGNLSGDEGAGRVISATATVSLDLP